jgi:hypothetical protein
MTWLIIGVILLAAFGPVLWLVPSKRDRRLSALRQRALHEGLVVELRRLPKLDAAAEDRVSAGGKVRDPLIECMAYSRTLPRRLRVLTGWRVLRHPAQDEFGDIPFGWVIDPTLRGVRAQAAREVEALVGWLAQWLEELPEDVIGVEMSVTAISVYWLEKAPGNEATVAQLGALLGQFEERVLALDQRKQDEVGPDDS